MLQITILKEQQNKLGGGGGGHFKICAQFFASLVVYFLIMCSPVYISVLLTKYYSPQYYLHGGCWKS